MKYSWYKRKEIVGTELVVHEDKTFFYLEDDTNSVKIKYTELPQLIKSLQRIEKRHELLEAE